jgi:hypothetical protein
MDISTGSTEDLRDVADDLKARRDEIARRVIDDWYGIREREPWLGLPEDLDQDHLPDLITALADTALATFFAEDVRSNMVWTAVEHGEQRRESGYEENLIYREYTQLRSVVWSEIRDRYAGSGKASAAVVRLDAAISLALGGSLRGFYRTTLESSADWPAAVGRLIDEFAFRGDV